MNENILIKRENLLSENSPWKTPKDSTIELFILNLQMDMKNQLTFDNMSAQNDYFNSLTKYEIDKSYFQRAEGIVRVPLHFDEAVKYTYCRYKNNDKWFYGFLLNPTYVNEHLTTMSLVTDPWQTFQFDIEFGVSFISREHVSNDSIGAHTFPEDFELGEYIINDHMFLSKGIHSLNPRYLICLESTRRPNGEEYIASIKGVLPSAIGKYLYINTDEGRLKLQNDINSIIGTSLENIDAIKSVYLVHPLCFLKNDSVNYMGEEYISGEPTIEYYEMSSITHFQDNMGSYTPINKKLLTFPYVYYNVSNGAGIINTYRQEYFKNKKFECATTGIVTAGNSIKLIPQNYKNYNSIIEKGRFDLGYNPESIPLGKIPILNWASDTYTAWLVNNGLNQDLTLQAMKDKQNQNFFNGSINSLTDLLFNPLGSLGNSITTSTDYFFTEADIVREEQKQMMSRHIADLVPPHVGGEMSIGDVNVLTGNLDFTIFKMTIRPEYAKKIDGFFYKYGYQVNETKMINIHKRVKFDYIKTEGANIFGDIPQVYMDSIKKMFNNGVTFWHNPSTFLKYSTDYNDNSIL